MLLISRTKNLETSNFQAESWVNPFRKYSNSDKGDSDHRKTFFHNLEIFFFLKYNIPTHYFQFCFCPKTEKQKKKENCDYLKCIFVQAKNYSFSPKHPQELFVVLFYCKTEVEKQYKCFDQNHGLTPNPFAKYAKCDYLKCIFLQARNDSFLSKRFPNIISRSFLPQNRK